MNVEDLTAPDDFWREVPCGHPPDPVAWVFVDGPVCHCGQLLDDAKAVSEEPPPGAPGPVVGCDKCGCFVAIPSRGRDEKGTTDG